MGSGGKVMALLPRSVSSLLVGRATPFSFLRRISSNDEGFRVQADLRAHG